MAGSVVVAVTARNKHSVGLSVESALLLLLLLIVLGSLFPVAETNIFLCRFTKQASRTTECRDHKQLFNTSLVGLSLLLLVLLRMVFISSISFINEVTVIFPPNSKWDALETRLATCSCNRSLTESREATSTD